MMFTGLFVSAFLYAIAGPPVASHWASSFGLRAFGVFTAVFIVRWIIALAVGERGTGYWAWLLIQCASPFVISLFVFVAERS
jgi:hypothetical protein